MNLAPETYVHFRLSHIGLVWRNRSSPPKQEGFGVGCSVGGSSSRRSRSFASSAMVRYKQCSIRRARPRGLLGIETTGEDLCLTTPPNLAFAIDDSVFGCIATI